jgi:hypothetical protein
MAHLIEDQMVRSKNLLTNTSFDAVRNLTHKKFRKYRMVHVLPCRG